MRALLVHNENAGTHPVARADIEEVLRQSGIETCYCSHGNADLPAALAGAFDLIVAAGGDGTVGDVVSQLEDIDTPIGILPLGGSNNIANALSVDGDWRRLPSLWALNRTVRLDRCEAEGPWGRKFFVEGVGSGVLTDATDRVDENPRSAEEKQRNGRAAFRHALKRAEPFACAIDAGGWSWEGDCLMVEVMNIPFVGSRLALAHGALPADGLFDIVIVEPDQRSVLHDWAEAPDDNPCPIASRLASAVSLTVHDRPFRLDDRSPNENLAGTVDVRIRATGVKILLPEDEIT